MTPLIVLSIAFVAFNGGFALGFMLLAMFQANSSSDEESGAPEGPFPFSQPRSPAD